MSKPDFMRLNCLLLIGAFVVGLLFSFVPPGKSVQVIQARATPFTGGGYGAPTGMGYSVKILAPCGHQNFKALGLGVGQVCLPLGVQMNVSNKPAQIFFKGDTLELVASHLVGAAQPLKPCKLTPSKGMEGVVGLLIDGKEVRIDIPTFKLPEARDTVLH